MALWVIDESVNQSENRSTCQSQLCRSTDIGAGRGFNKTLGQTKAKTFCKDKGC